MPPENIDVYIAIQVLNAERSSSVLSLDEIVDFL
jgi:hypothetical protein